MKKYISIIKSYFKGSLMNQMEYKFNFIAGGTFELVWMVMYIIFIDVLFIHTENINGWNKYQMLLLTFQGGLMDSIFTFCIVPGLKRLPEMINKGTLDFILLKPINKRFNISFNEFDIPQVKNILINIFGIIYCVGMLKIEIKPINFSIYLLLSVNGFFIIYSIMFILMSSAFWFIRTDIVMGIGSELITIGNKPASIYPNTIQKIFTYIIPILVCFNFPILYLINALGKQIIIYSLFSGIFMFIMSNYIFNRGLRRYTSAGS